MQTHTPQLQCLRWPTSPVVRTWPDPCNAGRTAHSHHGDATKGEFGEWTCGGDLAPA